MTRFANWLAQAPCALLAAAAAAAVAIEPNHGSASANAHHIFNAIHSAGRQWGSSVHHNGLGFLPVVMPRGTLMYHGGHSAQVPPDVEWLALEVEHAEAFGSVVESRQSHHDSGALQMPLGAQMPGYLHVYRAHRDLNLLYVDGMSAAKSRIGTLDSQDLVLRENKTASLSDERGRARSLCGLMAEWGYDGLMRMETGFEVVYCDFSVGLDLVRVGRMYPFRENPRLRDFYFPNLYQWARAASERYDGIGGDRVRIDFSSMVSSFFFPVNVSNPDPERRDLPRLVAASLDELRAIKTRVRHVSAKPRRFTINWQAVVDMIVSRFSSRFTLMASSDVSSESFIKELDVATLTYVDAPPHAAGGDKNRTAEAVEACTKHYLLPIYFTRDDWSLEDSLIHTAIETVMSGICNRLFTMRSLLEARPPDAASRTSTKRRERAVAAGRRLMRNLRDELAWTTWMRPQVCPPDEFLFTAMWPFGARDDHWRPGCRSSDEIMFGGRSYWSPYDDLI